VSSAGYSGTPLPKKLGIKEGFAVALIASPDGFERLLEPLPPGGTFRSRAEEAEVTIFFTTARSALAARIDELAAAIRPDRALWIAWPKRTSGVDTDITEDVVRELALPLGLVDNKVCAIDGTWSGLRLVWRVELR
jgi:hypothetical protein